MRWIRAVRSCGQRIRTALAATALLGGSAAAVAILPAAPAAADAAHQAVIGMPFTGKWAYNVNVNPPYTDANSSHPSVHAAPGGGDWATDLYAAEGTPVKLEVTFATGSVTYSWASSSTSCGQSTRINIAVGGVGIGWLYFAHLNNAVNSGTITNGMTIGTVHDWGGCNPGPHVHVEFRNTSNYACWVDHGHPGVTLNQSDNLGVLGSTNTGSRQACSSIPSSGPSAPGAIAVLRHGSRVDLSWGAASGATSYQVVRNGTVIATTTGTSLLDVAVSPAQDYSYAVIAVNSNGSSAPTTRYVQTSAESADRAYLQTRDGPAECARAGDSSYQALVCTVLKSTGWVTVASTGYDWGYSSDRTWLTNADGTVSYCRRVNSGNQVACDRFDGTSWTSSTSPQTDLGYDADRAYLSTKDGPAVCGRTGDSSYQSVDCTVLKSTGWVTVNSASFDWGYATDRTWLTNADGTVSYCRRVNSGNQVACDRFDGTSWTSSTSPQTDLGYDADRAYLSTKDGPAVCGRTGDSSHQSVDCTVLKSTGWVTVYSANYDWGYSTDRTWLTNAYGSVSYCRRVNFGDQVACDRFDGTSWTSSTSPRTDLAYSDNRSYLSTKDGPAACGRTGDSSHQSVDCTVLKSTGWVTVYSANYDWGYSNDRGWLANADGTVSYCRRVNFGDQVACDRFDGTSWTSSTSPRTDLGYPDTF